MRMFTAFFALVKPASNRAKPGCIQKTRKAVTNTQMVSAMYWAWETALPSTFPSMAQTEDGTKRGSRNAHLHKNFLTMIHLLNLF